MKNLKPSFANTFAGLAFLAIFGYFWLHHDATINETYKNILLIITGFIWGSSSASKKKDDTIQAMQDASNDTPVIADKVDTQNVTIKTDETGKP